MSHAYSEEMEEMILMIVSNAGAANSKTYEALDAYEKNDLEKAYQCLDEASTYLAVAHENQANLMGLDVQGGENLLSVILIHAMDTCMIAANSIQYTKKMIAIFEAQKKTGG